MDAIMLLAVIAVAQWAAIEGALWVIRTQKQEIEELEFALEQEREHRDYYRKAQQPKPDSGVPAPVTVVWWEGPRQQHWREN